MHFSKCKNPNVLSNCPQRPHVHLWADNEETQKVFIPFPLTNKQDAKKVVNDILFLGSDEARKNLMSKLEAEIDAIDLPENLHAELRSKKKSSHLKRVK